MRQTITVLTVLLFLPGLVVASQDAIQLTPVPPKPTCTPVLPNGACANLWRNYNRALTQRQREELQIYVNRRKELSSAATAPLQQQIADLNKLVVDQQSQIGKLQDQMQADTTAALQAAAQAKEADTAAALQEKAAFHKQGLSQGLAAGAGAMLLLFALIKLAWPFTVNRKSSTATAPV